MHSENYNLSRSPVWSCPVLSCSILLSCLVLSVVCSILRFLLFRSVLHRPQCLHHRVLVFVSGVAEICFVTHLKNKAREKQHKGPAFCREAKSDLFHVCFFWEISMKAGFSSNCVCMLCVLIEGTKPRKGIRITSHHTTPHKFTLHTIAQHHSNSTPHNTPHHTTSYHSAASRSRPHHITQIHTTPRNTTPHHTTPQDTLHSYNQPGATIFLIGLLIGFFGVPSGCRVCLHDVRILPNVNTAAASWPQVCVLILWQ